MGHRAEGGVVMEAAPRSALVVVETDLLLEPLVVAFDAPAQLREADERDDGYVPGSRHLPYRTARAAAEAGLLDGRPVVTICETGARAAIAASVLQAVGVPARPVLNDGIAGWQGRGTGLASFRRCGS